MATRTEAQDELQAALFHAPFSFMAGSTNESRRDAMGEAPRKSRRVPPGAFPGVETVIFLEVPCVQARRFETFQRRKGDFPNAPSHSKNHHLSRAVLGY